MARDSKNKYIKLLTVEILFPGEQVGPLMRVSRVVIRRGVQEGNHSKAGQWKWTSAQTQESYVTLGQLPALSEPYFLPLPGDSA